MIPPDLPQNEQQRLAALRELDLLDTSAEERFDRVTRLATRIFGVPIALVSLVDADRQWFKSNQGLDVDETPRDVSFCGHAIHDRRMLQVSDAANDPRFADNPLVAGPPGIRFYVGCPLAAPDGSLIGTLCLLDDRPHDFSIDDLSALRDLAAIVEQEMAMSRLVIDDDLTGLRNRRGLELVGTQALETCRRQNVGATVLYADVDGLKEVNDQFGHLVGDQLICDAAALFRETFRDADVTARIGGDEFAAVLSGADDSAAAVERLLAELARRNSHRAPPRVTLSMAVGSARFDPLAPEPLTELLGRADEAMYRMKRSTRAV